MDACKGRGVAGVRAIQALPASGVALWGRPIVRLRAG
jgi:hypothetical protein